MAFILPISSSVVSAAEEKPISRTVKNEAMTFKTKDVVILRKNSLVDAFKAHQVR